MQNKIKALQLEFGLNNFLFTSKEECFYLTGSEFEGFWLVFIKDNAYIICSRMIREQVESYFKLKSIGIEILVAEKSFLDTLLNVLKREQVKEIIADSRYVKAQDYIDMSEALKKQEINLIAKPGILNKSRQVKSKEEIKKIKMACKIVSQTADIIRRELKAGISEIDIHYRILEIFSHNKVKESFSPIVAAGKNSANPHHISSNYKISKNDLVLIDIGCLYEGYASDLTRVYCVDRVDRKIKDVFNIVKEAHDKVISGIKAGLPISFADETARNIIDSYGYKDNFIHSTGHSIGIEVHEEPRLSHLAKGNLLSDMVFAVEPGIYLAQQFGVRIEDTILIKQDGCEVLTSASI
jgi:Xaa-Pro aminopeptidase